ncbi:DUF427-domain-containing protein [Auriscalpium vulgare]|uniref:DUF427-domain-containing protein n=1 Tax=Auriscalpium vulgare TaxID=40419 RepID=A0ACB8RD41_9AGAM|nr:DUF427-domain-containing protein [Auriscalpium vulgare]
MVKVIADGTVIADSTNTVFIEGNHYFPVEDIKTDLFVTSQTTYVCPVKGDAEYRNVNVNGKTINDVAWVYPNPKAKVEIKGRFAFDKSKVQIAE